MLEVTPPPELSHDGLVENLQAQVDAQLRPPWRTSVTYHQLEVTSSLRSRRT